MSKEIEELQGEVKILKNEIKEILVGIKEYLITAPQNAEDSNGGSSRPGVSKRRAVADEESGEPSGEPQGHVSQIQQPIQIPQSQQFPQGMMQPLPNWAQQNLPPQWWPQPPAQQVLPQSNNTVVPVMDKANDAELPMTMNRSIDTLQSQPSLERQAPFIQTNHAREAEAIEKNGRPQKNDSASNESVNKMEDTSERSVRLSKQVASSDVPRRTTQNADCKAPEVVTAGALDSSIIPENDEMVTFTSVALLAPWVDANVRKLGKEKLKSIIKLYADMGQMKNTHRDLLLRLIGLEGEVSPNGKATLKESMRALAELENLVSMSKKDRGGAAILSMYINSHPED